MAATDVKKLTEMEFVEEMKKTIGFLDQMTSAEFPLQIELRLVSILKGATGILRKILAYYLLHVTLETEVNTDGET